MKSSLSKSAAKEEIDSFFRVGTFSASGVKKIKRLAMKYKLKLGPYRKQFCKSCLSQLSGSVRITKTHKTVICKNCGYRNKFKLTL